MVRAASTCDWPAEPWPASIGRRRRAGERSFPHRAKPGRSRPCRPSSSWRTAPCFQAADRRGRRTTRRHWRRGVVGHQHRALELRLGPRPGALQHLPAGRALRGTVRILRATVRTEHRQSTSFTVDRAQRADREHPRPSRIASFSPGGTLSRPPVNATPQHRARADPLRPRGAPGVPLSVHVMANDPSRPPDAHRPSPASPTPRCASSTSSTAHQDRAWFIEHKAEYEAQWARPLAALLAQVSPAHRALLQGTPPARSEGVPHPARRALLLGQEPLQDPRQRAARAARRLRDGRVPGRALRAARHRELRRRGRVLHASAAAQGVARDALLDPRRGAALGRLVDDLLARGYSTSAMDSLKTAPRGVDPEHPRIALLKQKGLALGFPRHSAGLIGTPGFADWLVERAGRPPRWCRSSPACSTADGNWSLAAWSRSAPPQRRQTDAPGDDRDERGDRRGPG
jgi:hypothetical protein